MCFFETDAIARISSAGNCNVKYGCNSASFTEVLEYLTFTPNFTIVVDNIGYGAIMYPISLETRYDIQGTLFATSSNSNISTIGYIVYHQSSVTISTRKNVLYYAIFG